MTTPIQTTPREPIPEPLTTLVWEVQQIVHVLQTLPIEKIIDVRDYVFFLQSRYVSDQVVDEGDEWTDEDLIDATHSTMRYAEQSMGLVDDYAS